jgi:putative AlgH/UPF0301 family transcriptional regulator
MVDLANPQTSRAVLIGISRYDSLPALPAVARNVERLGQIFTDARLWDLPSTNCRVLVDQVDPRAVARAVRIAAAEVGPDGLLIVYFAGHGLIDPIDDTLILALGETEMAAPYEAGLPYESLRRSVAAGPPGRRIVILDCCYAGRAGSVLAAEDRSAQAVADQATIEQTCLLVSASRNRRSHAPEGDLYTAFTGELVRVLGNGIPGGPSVLDVRTVWQVIVPTLVSRQLERPEIRSENGGEGLPLVRNAAGHDRDMTGRILVAASHVADRDLRQTVILVLRHDPARGALGVRINVPSQQLPSIVSDQLLSMLKEPAVIFDGGPVSGRGGDGFIAVAQLRHSAAAPVRFSPIRDRLGTIAPTSNLESMRLAVSGVRLFSGYFGWGPKRLEQAIDEGRLIRTMHPSLVALSAQPEDLWTTLQAHT